MSDSVAKILAPIFTFLLISFEVNGQVRSWHNNYQSDSIKHVIGKNIFRLHLAGAFIIPGYGDIQLLGNYETRISRDISLNTRAGLCFQLANINRSSSLRTKTEIGYYAFASVEARYFFLMRSRIAAKRKIANYSGFYLSAEQNLLSPPILLQNIEEAKALDAKTAFYINTGFQKQFGNLSFNWSIGVSPYRVNLTKKDAYLVPVQSWLSLGYVFGPSK